MKYDFRSVKVLGLSRNRHHVFLYFNILNLSPLDVPMSSGMSNIRSKGNLLNCYEFEWDPSKGSEVYIIVRDRSLDSMFLLLLICLIVKFLIVIGSLYA